MKRFFIGFLLLCILCSVISPVSYAETSIQEETNPFKDKTISILGDSISTYENVSSGNAAGTTNSTIKNNRVYYKDGRNEVTLNDTWWIQAANTLDAKILVNNSYSGTTIFSPFSDNEELGYLSRPYNLHDDTGANAGEEPDIIVVYIGTNDISYHKSRLGSFSDINFDTLIREINGEYAYQKPTTSAEAYAIMIHKIVTTYKESEVYCFTNLPRGKQAITDASATERLNNSITKIAEHFGCYVVDLYNESGITADERVYSRYLLDSYLHPNKKGMDAIESAFISSLYKNSKYASEKTVQNITYTLNDTVVNEGIRKEIYKGEEFSCTFTKLEYGNLDIKVTMNNEDITSSAVNDNTVYIPSVDGDISITASVIKTPRTFKSYRFSKSNNTLTNIYENENYSNNITKLNTGAYKTQQDITVCYDTPWTILFRADASNTNRISVMSTDNESGFTLVLDAKRNILGIFDINNTSEIFGIDLNKYDIKQTEHHTYKIINSHNIDGSNTFTVYVDAKETGVFDSRFVNGVFKDNDISYLYEKDFIFNLIGTENGKKIEYIQIWGNDNLLNHKHTLDYPQETSPKCEEPGSTTYTCDCGVTQTLPDIPATGHKESDWMISKETSAAEAGEKYKECLICNKVTQTQSIPQLKCDKPVINNIVNTDSGIKVTWNEVTGADSYRVYRHLKNGKWVYLCTTTSRTYIDTDVKNGYWYYYTVRAVNEAGYSDFYSTGNFIQYLYSPVFKKPSNTQQGITLSWNAVRGAQGYYLYRKAGNNNWQYYCRVNSTTFTDKKVTNGVTYSYRIKACRNKTVSGFYYSGVSIERLALPLLKTPINTDSGIKVLWNKVNGAAGYFVYRIENGYWKYIGRTSTNSFTDVNAVPGKTYTYTVKAYNSLGQHSTYNTSGVSYKRLTTPQITDSDAVSNGINIKWNSVKGAKGYYVYRKTANNSWKYIGRTSGRNFTDNSAQKGTTYIYTVKAYSGSITSTYSAKGIAAKR